MYKVVTPYTKKKKNLKFLKYWPSSRDFNKLVIKANMYANTYFWIFLCCMKIQYDFFFIFERLGCMHENKKIYIRQNIEN
jgi:hypothetical protein